jgi:hypothetical protein
MADGNHTFSAICLSHAPEIHLKFKAIVRANQIESSLGIGELRLFVPGEIGV